LCCDRTQQDLAIGVGSCLLDALCSLEEDLLRPTPIGPQVSQCPCWVCASNALVPIVAGSPQAASVLDGHLLARRDFWVEWREGQFHFLAEWTRKADTLTPEVRQRLLDERLPGRWQHGEHVWEYVPVQNQKTGAWVGFHIRSISRPHGSKDHCPREKRRVEVGADTLGGVLAAAEEQLAAAVREDEAWLRQTSRCT
jgi:hypothetical protein